MTLIYFDPISGASGDMILGALMDAGAPLDSITESLEALGLPGWELAQENVLKGGVRATRAVVTTNDGARRSYSDIKALIAGAPLPEGIRSRALETFAVLANAEAKVHSQAPGDVHFHEVGGLDAIVDIVGSSAALEHFAPDAIVTGALPLGSGTVTSAHGPLPVPAPAVTEILTGAVVYGAGGVELVTPTGAALLKANSTSFGTLPPLRPASVGYGAGERDLELPNVLRVLVGQALGDDRMEPRPGVVLETNLDDMSPELLPHVVDELLAAGAQDAWLVPIVMKKGRPAFTLAVLTDASGEDALRELIYKETTTLGIRSSSIGKDVLAREWVAVEVAGQPVSVKLARRAGRIVSMSPEYEDARRAARSTEIPLKEIYALALSAAAEAAREATQLS